jgi:hypothetical protein
MLKNGTFYQDLGTSHFDNRDKGKQVFRLLNRLQSPGLRGFLTALFCPAGAPAG